MKLTSIKNLLNNKKVQKALDSEKKIQGNLTDILKQIYHKMEQAIIYTANSNYEKYFVSIFSYRYFFYLLLLFMAIGLGIISTFIFRGSLQYASMLSMLTLGWVIPVAVVVYILWTAYEKNPSDSMEFTIGILLTACFCIFMQWGFFKAGDLLAMRDIRNAKTLCESASDRVSGRKGNLAVDREYLAPVLPNGTLIELGHIRPPQIVHLQHRTYDPEQKKINPLYTGSIIDLFVCRFYDPRVENISAAHIYNYDYVTKTWYRGS